MWLTNNYDHHFKSIGLLSFLTIIMAASAFGQNQTVNITTTGQGESLQKATDNALRSAIEQTFGAFISSRTEILNDQLVSDQIASVASGNIQSYEILAQRRLSETLWGVTLRAVVSVTKLTSFVQARGVQVEIQGGLFAANIRREEFYDRSEVNAIKHFLDSRIQSTIFYNYSLSTHPPKVEGEHYSIELEIGVKTNSNLFTFFDDFFNLLKSISLSSSAIDFRKQSNLPVYTLIVKDVATYYLRNQESFALIRDIERKMFLKASDFVIKSNPKFDFQSSNLLIRSNVIANNFILFNREHSPNPGVYWSWLPYGTYPRSSNPFFSKK